MIECNVTLQLHCITTKQLYIKLIFLAWKQALHLEGSQDVTQEPHAKGDVSARGGVRKESLQQSLTSFHFHPVNCKVLKLSPETRNRSVSFFFFEETDLPRTYLDININTLTLLSFCVGTHKHYTGAPHDNFWKSICLEDDLRSRIFRTSVVKFLACLPLLGFFEHLKSGIIAYF